MHPWFIFTTVCILGLTNALFFDRKAFYLDKYAPKELARLAEYRTGLGKAITAPQSAALTAMEKLIRDYAVEEIPAIEAACEQAFDKDECKNILGGDQVKKLSENPAAVLKRRPDCGCYINGDFCGGGTHCVFKSQNCLYYSGGCGVFYTGPCDGICG